MQARETLKTGGSEEAKPAAQEATVAEQPNSPPRNSSVSESEQFLVESRSETGSKALALLRIS